MNIYEKIQNVKEKLLKTEIKKSGENKFSNFKYFELADIIPHIVKYCNEVKLYTQISFNTDLAVLRIINTEKPDEIIEYTSPMKDIEIKGANSIQALGGVETYQRRYLYLTAFDIIEADLFDSIAGSDKNEEDTSEKPISKAKVDTIIAIGKEVGTEKAKEVLAKYGYTKSKEVKNKDFKAIVDELKGA